VAFQDPNCEACVIGSGMVSVVNRVKELRRRARDSPVRFQRAEPRRWARKASVEICSMQLWPAPQALS